MLRLSGVIGQVGPLRRGLSLASLAATIERAFSLRHLRAVALTINSPGGSPVQSALIHKRIRSLAEEKEVPVYAFAEDVAASGGYWLACAADEIYGDENSIVGSIGVLYSGFGFSELINRYGVERRLYTAGARKVMLDPFSPEKPEDVSRLKSIQEDMHDEFKALVRSRRGERLKAGEEDLFSGEFWTGRRALELGLVDGLGDLHSVMRERFGERVKLRPIIDERRWLPRRLGFGGAGPMTRLWASEFITALEERAMWSRFGL